MYVLSQYLRPKLLANETVVVVLCAQQVAVAEEKGVAW
jgi:hypothetical protein